MLRSKNFWIIICILILFVIIFFKFPQIFPGRVSYDSATALQTLPEKIIEKIKNEEVPVLDKAAYDKKLEDIANNPPPKVVMTTVTTKDENGKTITKKVPLDPQPVPPPGLWPVKTVYPNPGAILPFKRVIAFYGNLYSKKMGVLGEYPEDVMLAKLQGEMDKWQKADPNTPVLPALHYIAVTAQGSPGEDGKYRLRMPGSEIEKVIKMAEKINAIVFLDIQVGFSDIQTELPLLEKYIKLPQVHLGMDPEFSMKTGVRPGKVVGTYDASDVNFAAEYLAKIVKENNLPPKILVVHRYTQKMLTNYQNIKPLPEVQIVIHMDGWGPKAKKIGTYNQFVYPEPVQFTGFKLFYKNDILNPGTVLMTPEDLLKLNPQPVYIQYQ